MSNYLIESGSNDNKHLDVNVANPSMYSRAHLRWRDTVCARVLTVYSKFTYACYNFHLKQPRLEVYFFQPKIPMHGSVLMPKVL